MVRRNDFMEGLLIGLYNSGVGNPSVQRTNEEATRASNDDLTAKMAEAGKMPNTLPNDHPVRAKIGGFISSLMGGPSTAPLTAASFVNNPNFSQPYMDTTTGRVGVQTGQGTTLPQGKTPITTAEFVTQRGQQRKFEEGSRSFDHARSLATLMGKPGSFDSVIASAEKEGRDYLTKDEISNALRAGGINAMGDRAKVWEERLRYQQVKDLVQMTGIKPDVMNTLQKNNMRADRALSRLNSGPMTWQDFNTVITDWQGIMQGGVPHEEQYGDSKFPNWRETTARWQTYAGNNPTENVPTELVDYMKEVVQGLKDVDNSYLQQNADYVSNTLGSTIPGFNKPGGLGSKVQQGTGRLIRGGVDSNSEKESAKEKLKKKLGI